MPKNPLPEGVDPQCVLFDVELDGGKYRMIYHSDDKRPQGFRHGVPHGPTTDHLTSNAIRALVARVAALEENAAGLLRHCAINPLTMEGVEIYDALKREFN
jgi:hypothetical protein